MIFKNFLQNLIEYQNYISHHELNIVTATIIIAIVVAAIQSWGILKQNKKIWKHESGKALPITFFVFQLFYCLGYLIYGFQIKSGALIISNFVGLLYIPIIFGLIKFKRRENGSFKEELLLSPLFMLTVPIILLIDKKWSLIAILGLAVFAISRFIKEFSRTKETKNVSPKFIISFLASSLIWLGYGYEINDFGLMISSSTTALGATLFLAMYLIFKYKIFNTKSPTND